MLGFIKTKIVNEVRRGIDRTVKNAFENFFDPVQAISSIRRGRLPVGAEQSNVERAFGSFNFSPQTTSEDWRVRIMLPDIPSFKNSSLLTPLIESDESLVFPTLPQILITHTADYDSIAPTHSNYAYPVYSNSTVEDINIACEWPVENEADGKYWIAAVHFFRSVTKMFYGDSPNRGAPPPVCYLKGYGDYVFNNIPVVVKMFSMDLNDGVDYIKVPLIRSLDIGQGSQFFNDTTSSSYTYVPTLSRLSIVVTPAFSRNETRQFNLDEFTKGGYIGKGKDKGFI